jgi:hypothetical protein
METTILSALVFCSDSSTLRVLQEPLEARRISRQIVTSVATTLESLASRKFDLLIVDLDGLEKDWLAGFYKVNGCSDNIPVIAVAQDAEALVSLDKKAARFLLQKPLAADSTGRTIDAACHARTERRPAYRHAVNLSVLAVLLDKGKERKLPDAMLRNISLTGASLESGLTLPIGETLSLRFCFPESGLPFQATGRVIWSDSQGHCGIQFQHVSDHELSALRNWLARRAGETSVLAPERPVAPVRSSYSRFGF